MVLELPRFFFFLKKKEETKRRMRSLQILFHKLFIILIFPEIMTRETFSSNPAQLVIGRSNYNFQTSSPMIYRDRIDYLSMDHGTRCFNGDKQE